MQNQVITPRSWPAALILLTLLQVGCTTQDPAEPPANGTPVSPAVTGKAGDNTTSVPVDEREAREVSAALDRPDAQVRRQKHFSSLMSDGASPGMRAVLPPGPCCPPVRIQDREKYRHPGDSPVKLVSEEPVSTFSIDVDTGAYANVRRFLNSGQLPPADAVRVEELINYFDYAYPAPGPGDRPFRVNTRLASAPWNPDRALLQVGIKGYEVPADSRPAANLVFLVDVSGSMQAQNKLPLLKSALGMLAQRMTAEDRISMVVYAGAAGVVLEPTPGDQRGKIRRSLDRLTAGGSTNGGAGIRAAYDLAQEAFIEGGINRVILASDGDFNVGTVNFESLLDLVERKREQGVALTTLGFGQGNYNDHLVEQLANKGNGNYAYIDNLNEARKVLVEEMSSTLQIIAKDVKIQVEFNPAVVAEYRLIGYENRALNREDFNNDQIDAGEIGAGHTVTALYELAFVDSAARRVDPLRYGRTSGDTPRATVDLNQDEAAFVRLRYKPVDGETSKLIEMPVRRDLLTEMPDDLRFAAAVAAFGQLLRGGDYLDAYSYADVIALARDARGRDVHGYRGEFLNLAKLAEALHHHGGTSQAAVSR